MNLSEFYEITGRSSARNKFALTSTNSQKLQEILLSKINHSSYRRITFAQYMNTVLYEQNFGYYNSGVVGIGSQGDFFTSSSLGKDFGELLAIQLSEMWHYLGCPNPFQVVEIGAGNGELAQDILNFWHHSEQQALIEALSYTIVEQSPVLLKQQQQRLEPFNNLRLTWKTLAEISDSSIEGCIISNELVDAFPVHLITKQDHRLQEVYLTIEDGKLTEIIDDLSTEKLAQYFDLIEVDLLQSEFPDGYRTEVNLQALDWIRAIASKIKRGYVLTIDYGYPAERYYRPSRNQGTLQCYYQHRHHNNPYVNLGDQDFTAHVDFTALQRQGELVNLHTIGFTQQGLFLMALGLGDRLDELSNGKFTIPEIFKRRNALHQLINPTGLGGFGVLIQGKNLTASEKTLQGLVIPD
ncbi:MAG: class I SAM-dependent methyltransferase [Cyanobacteria bacterium P01_G01_bin.67]